MPTGVVIVAAGAGARLGADRPKAFVLLRDRPLVSYAIDAALALPGLAGLVVVVPPGYETPDHPMWQGLPPAGCVHLVAGGAQRGDSVLAGVRALPPVIDIVLVHDAARCLAPTPLFERIEAAVRAGAPAVVPGLAVVDTIKQVDASGHVVTTPDRASLRAIQTPQGFDRDTLEQAHSRHGSQAFDDAALVELLGVRVLVVPGDPRAVKVTTAADLAAAALLLD